MAQKNMLQYIILGLLENEKKTGYDLKRLFETEIGELGAAKHSQIYLELKHLETQGYITSETALYINKLEKTYYTITEKGKELFTEWLKLPTDTLPSIKDEFVLKLYFIRNKDDERIHDMLLKQYSLRASKLAHLQERKVQLFSSEEEIRNNYGHFMILNLAIERETTYVSWLGQYLN